MLEGCAVFGGGGGEGGVGVDWVDEIGGGADGVVGVLEEDGAVGLGVGAAAVVSGLHEVPGLLLFLHLALDEVVDVGMVDVEDGHFCGAAGCAAEVRDGGVRGGGADEEERGRR